MSAAVAAAVASGKSVLAATQNDPGQYNPKVSRPEA